MPSKVSESSAGKNCLFSNYNENILFTSVNIDFIFIFILTSKLREVSVHNVN